LLGINETLPQIEVGSFDYTSEFTIVCYTDGLTETENIHSDSLSTESMRGIISQNAQSTPDQINQALLFYAEEFKGENAFPDDIALLTLKVSDLNF
jgi:serine phosphatase RsbU (regulator of sigma subunit)